MRVLFLAHRIPYPPNKGDKIRAYHALRAMLARGHEVHLLAFADEARDLGHGPVLGGLCASATILPLDRRRARLRALGSIPGRGPLSLGYFGSPGMARAVRRTLAEAPPDAIFISSAPMAQYMPVELAPRTVVDLVDVDSEKWRAYAQRVGGPVRWLYRLEAGRLRRWERTILARAAHTVVTTVREAALLAPPGEGPRPARLHAITNGVDLERYRPAALADLSAAELPSDARGLLADPSTPRLVFIGAMDYYPNVEAACELAEQVLPLVRRREPRAELLIVGSSPTRRVRRLAVRPGVTVTGFVEDARPYLAAATVCAVPLRIARGVPNKVLEALASGRPVVATPEAVAALGTVAGEHLLTGRDAHELGEAILRLLRDDHLRRQLGAAARRFVEAEHRWAPHMGRLVDLLESVAAAPPPCAVSGARPGR